MTQAIFLSYASQDAEAARRICDALRAAGLEVWFDQNELTGGDAWDQKIRRQIKECSLFVPIISANTNAREEGYFRREWNIAVDRMMDMADHKAFLFPVILADLAEASAVVPEKFRERQWTRLATLTSDDAALKSFVERIAKVASGRASPAKSSSNSPSNGEFVGSSDTVKPVAPLQNGPQVSSSSREQPNLDPDLRRGDSFKNGAIADQAQHNRRRLLTYISAGVAAAGGVAAYVLLQPGKQSSTTSKAAPPSDPSLARAVGIIESTETTKSDVALAEDLVKGVLDQRPTDVDATITMARIHAYLLLRGWDRSEERFASTKRLADRALSLAPNNADAVLSLVTYMYMRRVELPRGAKLAREAIALAPDNPYAYRMFANVLSVTPGVTDDEVIAAAKLAADRFPKDALAQYEVGRLTRDIGRIEEAEKYFDLAIKLGPVANAIIAKARFKLWLYNDVPGMKALLDTLPERMRATDRAVLSQVLYGMAARDYRHASEALAAFPEPWMSDFDFTGPTVLVVGEILLLEGKADLAKMRFAEAQAELSRRKPVLTRFFNTVWLDSWVLMRLGKMQEARARNAIVHAEIIRPFRFIPAGPWIFSMIPRNLLLGERNKALELMREAGEAPLVRTFFRNAMEIDPRMEPFKKDKEIAALLTEPAKK
jgi:tetratricopeptide (TPR) repeat protein